MGSGDMVVESDIKLCCLWLRYLVAIVDQEDCGLAQYRSDRLY